MDGFNASRRISLPRRLTRWVPAAVAAAALAVGPGCTGMGPLWPADPDAKKTMPAAGDPLRPPVSQADVKYAPTDDLPLSSGKPDKVGKGPCTTMASAWRNYIDYLPDPTHDYREGPGIAGQVFLFDKATLPVEAEGSVTVELYDETPRPPGQQGLLPEKYVFDVKALKTLKSRDERFGKCYVMFLPWPTYRQDVTQVRITAYYESNGRRVIAPESKFALVGHPDKEATVSSGNGAQWAQGLSQPGFQATAPGGASSNNLGWGSYGAGSPATGMGSLNPGSPYANAPAGALPLGVVGSRPSGLPAGYGAGLDASAAMPITGAPMSGVVPGGFGTAGR